MQFKCSRNLSTLYLLLYFVYTYYFCKAASVVTLRYGTLTDKFLPNVLYYLSRPRVCGWHDVYCRCVEIKLLHFTLSFFRDWEFYIRFSVDILQRYIKFEIWRSMRCHFMKCFFVWMSYCGICWKIHPYFVKVGIMKTGEICRVYGMNYKPNI